jgi:Uncharacterized protein conserved in bacteria (DUF2066)
MQKLFLFLFFLFIALPADAETIESKVTVKSTKETAIEAKQAVLAEGEQRAFFMALEQIAPNKGREIYRRVGGANITSFVASFTIDREIQKSGYYEADITYRFDKEKLRGLLGEETSLVKGEDGIPTGEGLLIIPLYEVEEKLVLFDPENAWRAILNNVALEVGQGTLVLPYGDKQDVALLDDQAVLTAGRDLLMPMAKRYGTRNVVIAFSKSGKVNGKLQLDVSLRKAGGQAEDATVLHYVAKSAVETLDLLMARAAKDVSLKLRNSLDAYGLFGTSEDKKLKGLVIRAEYANAKEWQNIRKVLESAPQLERLDIGAVGVTFAQVTLFYRGTEALIQRALLAQNLTVDTSNAYWVVRLP